MYQDHLRWSEVLMFWRKESLDNDRFQNERFDARLLALDKCVTGRLEAAWRRTDRHRDKLEQLTLGTSGGVPTRNTASTSQGNGQCTSNEPTWNTANAL